MAAQPINCTQVLNLQALGIAAESITFSAITFEGDNCICVREKTGDSYKIAIVSLDESQKVMRMTINANSAIMNPKVKILGLKNGKSLQLFHLEEKTRLKAHELNAEATLWKWLSPDVIGIVTQTATFGWSINDDGPPNKLFDRHEMLSNFQIISFKADSELKWLILTGISGKSSNRIAGTLQLYSVDKNVSQVLEGHAATFFMFQLSTASKPSLFLSFASRGAQTNKFYIIELSSGQKTNLFKKQSEPNFSNLNNDDIPISMQADERLGLVFFMTKYGFLFILEVESAQTIFQSRIIEEPIFTTCPQSSTNGFLGISTSGRVLSISANDAGIMQYVRKNVNSPEIIMSLASKINTAGVADDLFLQRFNQMIAEGKFNDAVVLAVKAPGQMLRSPQTIQMFQSIPLVPGQHSPLLKYFTHILEVDKLNKYESLELCRLVLQQNKSNLIEKWLQEDKLDCSEELGDLVRPYVSKLALSIYLRSNTPSKVVELFAENDQFQNIVPYSQKVGFTVDYVSLVRNLMRANPDKATHFALTLVQGEDQIVDIDALVQVFMEGQNLPHLTRFLLEALKNNRPEEAHLQNKLLQLNLMNAPQVADAILGNKIFTHYDKQNVARMCERAGLYQRALENYTDIYDIKRALMHTQAFSPDFIIEYFANLSVKDAMECLHTMLQTNIRQNLQIVVDIACKYHEFLGVNSLITMFERFKSPEGMFLFGRMIINTSEDADVHLKYIKAACRVGQLTEVERICRESNFYEPEHVKNFLKEYRLADLLPLVIVCDRHNDIDDLVPYLYRNSEYKYIEILVQKINPKTLPSVVGSLIRLDCPENVIKQLIMSAPLEYSPEELLSEVEKHNRPKLVVQMLERALQNGSTDIEVHSALAKIYIDNNMSPNRFLAENQYYDRAKIGKYCESRNPQLSCIAYDAGDLPYDLIRVTNENSLFKIQARYLMRRKDEKVWAFVLAAENECRKQLITQIVQIALPESQNPEDISAAVRAFLAAGLTDELIEFLEKIVLENSIFSEHTNLQNLLILTGLNSKTANVSLYLERLDKYDAPEIAKKIIEHDRFEDAFTIYKKFGYNTMAIQIMVESIGDFDRALDFADKCNESVVWTILGQAQLGQPELLKSALTSFLRSGESTNYLRVIDVVMNVDDHWEELIKYLNMIRKTIRNSNTDNALILAFAKCDKLNELCEFIESANIHADLNRVGDQCFNSGLFQSAKALFSNSGNYMKLAVVLIYLKEYNNAIDIARKANNVDSWKGVFFVCIDDSQFRLAKIAALYVVVYADELSGVVTYYEDRGYYSQLLDMMESAISLEKSHVGIFTELAILYVKYKPTKTYEHLEMFWNRMNIPKVIKAVLNAHMWIEVVYLYDKYEEYDNAILTIIEHPSLGWKESYIKDIVIKVTSSESIYKTISFYIKYFPMRLEDLMIAVSSRIDPTRTIKMIQAEGLLHIVNNYLISQHCRGSKAVDEALNMLLIEQGDHEELLSIVETKTQALYDKLELAKVLQNHPLRAFRNIATYLMRQSNRIGDSIELCKRDGLYSQAIIHTAESNDPELAYSLIEWFLDKELFSFFSAALYHCYSLLPPDRVLESAWRHNAMDFATPFFIQTLASLNNRVLKLESKDMDRTKKEDENSNEFVPVMTYTNNLMIGGGHMFGGQ